MGFRGWEVIFWLVRSGFGIERDEFWDVILGFAVGQVGLVTWRVGFV